MSDQQTSLFSSVDLSEKLKGALSLVTSLSELNKNLTDENTWLREQLGEFKRRQFGKKSERWESPEQLVFNEAEVLAQRPDPFGDEDTEVEVTVEGHTKKRGHRKPLPESLPREVVKVELPVDEQINADGERLKVIGYEVSEKLMYVPAQISVIQYHRAKYGLDSGDYVKTAPPVPSIIPKGIATPELLAAVAIAKFGDGLPFYRAEEILERSGVEITRGTMARWMIKVAEACQPIWNVLNDRLLASFYVACDETHVQVLKENGRKAESKSWMWVRSTPFGSQKIVLFDYDPSRSSEVAKNLFEGFVGYLQCDGLNVYDSLAKKDGIARVGCNMHARRRFEYAATTGAKAGKDNGAKGLEFYKQLYDLEEKIRDKTPDERYVLRQEHAVAIWDQFKFWVETQSRKSPPKSKIGDAFRYFQSEYEYLTNYLKDGRLEPDNGFTERAIRKFAIGRNAWLFSDSVEGANASSVLYSLVITAKVNGINPFEALTNLLRQLPYAKNLEDYERLADIILAPTPTV